MRDKDEFYQTLIDGFARVLDSAFVADVLDALRRHPEAELHFALNKNQIASKRWLLDELHAATGGRLGTVYILGGWYGVLAAMLLGDGRFDVEGVVSVDIDPACAPVAATVNRAHVAAGRFAAVTADMHALDYGRGAPAAPGAATSPPARAVAPETVVNTSCEHLARFAEWYARLPRGLRLVLQSNDYFDCEEHTNCVASLEAFRRQAPMREPLFAGALAHRRYTRFMLIGRR